MSKLQITLNNINEHKGVLLKWGGGGGGHDNYGLLLTKHPSFPTTVEWKFDT